MDSSSSSKSGTGRVFEKKPGRDLSAIRLKFELVDSRRRIDSLLSLYIKTYKGIYVWKENCMNTGCHRCRSIREGRVGIHRAILHVCPKHS